LSFHTLDANDEDFPTQELRDQFTSILAALTCVPAEGDEGSLQASVRKMTDDEATQVAEEIFDLFIAIAQLEHSAER
jgi:lipase chaperone LimK